MPPAPQSLSGTRPPSAQPAAGPPSGVRQDAGLVSGEAVTLELRPARLASRLLAAGIDFLVVYSLASLLVFLVLAFATAAGLDSALATALVLVVLVASLVGYSVSMQVFNRGRTLGKLALGLRVVRDDGGPVSFRPALIREIFGLVVEKPGPLLGLPAVVCALAREDGKRVGDLLAGTIVINERIAQVGPVSAAPTMPPQLAGWAAGIDVSRLPSSLALRGREVRTRAASLDPGSREELGAAVVADFASYVGPPPPGTPGWAYISAVLAERRRRDVDRLTRNTGAAVTLAPGPSWGLPPAAPAAAAAAAAAGPVLPSRERGTAAYDGEWTPTAAGAAR